ncbi:MAG TPA: DUF4440 domain-containing protein [Blastocatellia bacterium]|nr:DUF4440 domain-containing protein [Blastocatellia bacterium]
MKRLKVTIALIFFAGAAAALAGQAMGYPAYLVKARKFGAKDCTFCHTDPAGGDGWNERGKWLIEEKERRKAEAVDPDWLADYKAGDSGGAKSAGPAAAGAVEQEIIKLENEWAAAWQKPDAETLKRILADDFTLTSSLSTGELTDKAGYIDLAVNRAKVSEHGFDKTKVRVYGDTAVVNTLFRMKATLDGKDWSGDFLFTDVWVKRGGQWQLVARHASRPAAMK